MFIVIISQLTGLVLPRQLNPPSRSSPLAPLCPLGRTGVTGAAAGGRSTGSRGGRDEQEEPLSDIAAGTFLYGMKWVWVKIRYPNNWMVNTKLD